jgi:hypothetical protein
VDDWPIPFELFRPDEKCSEAESSIYTARLERSIAELRVFLSDPVALLRRAMDLLEGTADSLDA